MQNIVILLCFMMVKFKLSEEYDGLIHALTRVFTRKNVQTVTAASTCWPPGDKILSFMMSKMSHEQLSARLE